MDGDLGEFGGTGMFFCLHSLLWEFVLIMQLFIDFVLRGWEFLKKKIMLCGCTLCCVFSVLDVAITELLLFSVGSDTVSNRERVRLGISEAQGT